MNAITALPALAVELDGTLLSAAEMATLESVVVRQQLSTPTACELTFLYTAGAQPLADLALGTPLRVQAGPDAAELFRGEVTAVEARFQPPATCQVIVRAYDLLHRLRKRQPVRLHSEVTLVDLAREMTSDLGIGVSGPERGPLWRRIIQYRNSDFDFLTSLAARYGLFLFLDDGVLTLGGLKTGGSAIELRLGEQLLEARLERNGATSWRSMTVLGWDPTLIEFQEAAATEATVERAGGVAAGSSGERTLANQTAPDATHLTSMAQAELDDGAAAEVVFSGEAEGSPELKPGRTVRAIGLGGPGDGVFMLGSVRHQISRERGFVSQISSELPRRPHPRPDFFVAPAIVKRIDDPEKLGRVSVSLPTLAGLETDWMCVLAAGSGPAKGLIALPEVDDRVMVLVSAENPATGLVLGSATGSRGLPDTGIENGTVVRFALRSPGGQRIELDDAKKCLRLTVAGGSYLELGPELLTLHSATGVLIDASGKSLAIQADKIDLRRG